jgi:outer membrane protein assembly factor BamB
MPGGFCAGSSNGDGAGADPDSAILACTVPYGNANTNVVNGRLLVYDAVHLAADGSLKVLWDSQAFNVQFLFNKFDPPVIDGGQIYVANYNGGVDLYRLAQ